VPPPQPDGLPDDGLEIEPAGPDFRLPDLGGGLPSDDLAEASLAKAPGDLSSPILATSKPADQIDARDTILRAFLRNRPQPPPAPQPAPPRSPQPAQPRPPERQAERRAQPEPISEAAWEEFVAGFMAGNINWNARRLGPEPGQPGCRAPQRILRSFGL
jgi:hypothetical protein